jgi:hypothetical protein
MTNRAPENGFAENLRVEVFLEHVSANPIACAAIEVRLERPSQGVLLSQLRAGRDPRPVYF